MIHKYAEIFCWKNVSSFCSATHIFSAKNISILYIESAKTVNEMTLNKLVKLTTLWTTGPWLASEADAGLCLNVWKFSVWNIVTLTIQTSSFLTKITLKSEQSHWMLDKVSINYWMYAFNEALDKLLFSILKYRCFSYFSTKTNTAGTR